MKIRRKIQDIALGEQDPGKDLFAILFLAFFVILLVQIQLISHYTLGMKIIDHLLVLYLTPHPCSQLTIHDC